MKLNCDMGESFGAWIMGNDASVMPWINMANIACGFHASDPNVMATTVVLAQQYNVMIGAHPGYQDKEGFGRRHIPHTLDEIRHSIAYQVGALDALCALHETQVVYVKPHGALYNDMMKDPALFEAIVLTVSKLNFSRPHPLSLMILSGAKNTAYSQIAQQYGVTLLFEAFADRAYTPDGFLVPRTEPNAVHHHPDLIKAQVLQLAQGKVKTTCGKLLSLPVDTICVHGDNPESIATIKDLAQLLNTTQS
ncbi:5-oxoprolinase subunit PxpA [Photobacterium lucens]|uniref:5-oxoprolinase subunit PxpA n=1 Tax=Photobacterium lucens TaxID=2562949 RepID=UPI00136AEFCA|nr:5-oxoprolinase subunit PxpA [Photobacterium lucens]MBP2701564.1 5-oxoprolinase subunit PxpA [Vibrio parahaemolyticus]MZG58166.1 5-oxoprolinase subunit PxpA [Photobacterium lucens]MZG81929.1 5-oxoprolinase subunit PxpA [Photobacterium lucens]